MQWKIVLSLALGTFDQQGESEIFQRRTGNPALFVYT